MKDFNLPWRVYKNKKYPDRAVLLNHDGKPLLTTGQIRVEYLDLICACVNALDGLDPEGIGPLVKLFPKLLKEAQESLEAIGGCDHAVGVCCCELIDLIEDSEQALARVRKEGGA